MVNGWVGFSIRTVLVVTEVALLLVVALANSVPPLLMPTVNWSDELNLPLTLFVTLMVGTGGPQLARSLPRKFVVVMVAEFVSAPVVGLSCARRLCVPFAWRWIQRLPEAS